MSPHVHPSYCHQGSIKGANLQQSQLWPASPLPLSFVLSTVVSASALIIDVSPCIRQTMMDWPWEVCKAAGWGTKQAPTHCVGLSISREVTAVRRGAAKQSVTETSQQISRVVFLFRFLPWKGAITLCNDFNSYYYLLSLKIWSPEVQNM